MLYFYFSKPKSIMPLTTHHSFSFTKTILMILLVGISLTSNAKEGMWLPAMLKDKETEMKAMGLEIPIQQLYNTDGTGLNNAVVLFGKGCTGELISHRGLVLTNHHCGYGTVQGLSSREHDYFANGFFAMSNQEEIPCPGLTVTFIRKMENVSDRILAGLADTMPDNQREEIISGRITALEKGYRYTTKMDATIKPYYNGNQYWVIISETYSDIRLVGFPPNGIGQFGGDTDNWMWPRHTGDFSMFRVYAGKDNKPASYAKDNHPYETKKFFTINASGYKEGDFTMVYGFPGYTQEYISSYQLNQVYSIIDPIRINVRTKKLDIWKKNMAASRDVFLKYTSKSASVANGWKKWQGEVRGLGINDVSSKKAAYEHEFQSWAATDDSLPYADDVLSNILANTAHEEEALKAEMYFQEAWNGIELLQQAARLNELLQVMRTHLPDQLLKDSLRKIADGMNGFYKNYDAANDKDVFIALMPLYINNSGKFLDPEYLNASRQYDYNYALWANDVYGMSLIAHQDKLQQFVKDATAKDSMRILADPAWRLYHTAVTYRKEHISPIISAASANLNYFNRLYMKAQMKENAQKAFYPDANLTLRLTYGKIQGIDPEGPASYSYQTNLDQAIAKDNPEVEEFKVPEKLKSLYKAKDYGRWAVSGTVPIAFLADNHTSGGNSGSPVLNGKGQLIGTNFDRIWEGTMSDLYFDPNLCRNISLDIRYTLFITEKFGGAGWLLKEMKIVK